MHNDAFLPLTLAAAATSEITIGTAIAVAFSRSPMALAYTAHDLQPFSRGRLVVGLGSQVKAHVTRRFSMPWGRAAPQMRDFVLAMRAVWQSWADGAALDFESEHYRLTLMPPNFVPPPHDYGPPPVLVAGVGDASGTIMLDNIISGDVKLFRKTSERAVVDSRAVVETIEEEGARAGH